MNNVVSNELSEVLGSLDKMETITKVLNQTVFEDMSWVQRQHETCKNYDCWVGACNRGGEQHDIDWDKPACRHWHQAPNDAIETDEDY